MPSVNRRYIGAVQPGTHEKGSAEAKVAAPVLLMVSGGADSTALLVLACTSELDIQDGRGLARIAPERIHVLHINHQLRGEASDADEAFVRKLCAEFGVALNVERIDVPALAQESSDDSNIENVAREVRYAAANKLVNSLCAQVGAPRSSARIVTAHTANDRAETFFMNAIKGSGAQGLSSIPRRRNRIVRPLLDYTHDQLCELLRARGIVWREDATNADTHYLRAYVRHEIVPRALERNPRLLENISTTCDILADEDIYLTQVAAQAFHTLTMRQGDKMLALDALRLGATEVVIARRVVRMAVRACNPSCRLDAAHVEAVLALVGAGAGSVTLPDALDVRITYNMLVFSAQKPAGNEAPSFGWLEVKPLSASQNSRVVVAPGEVSSLTLASGVLTARLREVAPGSDPAGLAQAHAQEWEGTSVLLDAFACGLGTAGGSLWVEGPQQGEIICPLGMHGQSKKLSDLLIDEKIPLQVRSNVPVVHTSTQEQIVWVAPIRTDERARVTDNSRVLVELHFRAKESGATSLWSHDRSGRSS